MVQRETLINDVVPSSDRVMHPDLNPKEQTMNSILVAYNCKHASDFVMLLIQICSHQMSLENSNSNLGLSVHLSDT